MTRSPWAALDLASRLWWRAVGRPIDPAGEHAWLDAPTSPASTVADGWLQAAADRVGGTVRRDRAGAGLLADMGVLDGPGFRAADLHPLVRDFYEHTADWRMEVWTGWTPIFAPGGEAIARLFGRRVGQLALPVRPLDVARGMDSTVVTIHGPGGEQDAAGWLRTLRSTGEYVYSGCYSTRSLPGADRRSIHVAFPLERGNVQVFLRPSVGAGGALWLHSPRGRFGQDGAYVVVEVGDRTHAARLPLYETFRVFVDDEGVLRTDHALDLWSMPVVKLHYRLERRVAAQDAA